MSRGPPHRYNHTGERSFRGYPPRYGEFSGSSSYGYYGGPPFKRPRRHSSDEDISPPPVNYGPAYFDPPYVRHQEVGLGEFNDFSSVSVEKDLKIHERDGSRKDYERSESHTRKRQSSTEGIGHFSQHQTTSAPTSPHSTKVSPRFSPRHSPRARPVTPPSSSAASQPLSITTSQPSLFSRAPSLLSSDETAAVGKHHPLLIVYPTSSRIAPAYVPIVRDKLKDGTGRPASLSSLSLHGGFNRKDSYPGPAVEAISPSAPDKDGEEKKGVKDATSDMMSKDELLQGMEKVDREITQVKQQINNLKKMQKQLEDEACKQPDEPQKEEMPVPEPKPRSVVQIIYEENRKKAEAAQARLAKFGIPLPGGKPLYNQPSDLVCYHENLRKAPAIKAKLVKYFQLRKQAKEMKNRQLCKEYKTLKQAWLTKMERHENNPKRKNKEAKLREFYEKVFPEIKKQREQTERFSRMGSRSNWGIVARSEAEFNEIVDNLNEQEANERHMRTLAVDPPPILDKEERRVKFINRNGLIRDPLAALNERKHKNIWTEKERRIFKDKFIHNPKDFDLISSFLPGKCVADCILFYYLTKKKEHYKQLSRRHNLKKRRRDQYGTTAGAPANKTRPGASESSAKGDHGGFEGEEELEEITDSAEESEENEEHPPLPVTTPQVATPTPPPRRPDHVETSRWSEKEIEIALQGLRECGRDWEAIARRVVTKTGAQCKNFYFNYKKKLHLEDLVAEHEKTKMQRAQQQQQQQKQQQQQPREQQQHQQQLQQPQQKEISSIPEKHEPTPKQSLDTSHPNKSNVKSNNAATSNVSTTNERVSTPVIVNTMSNPVGPPGTVQTASTTASISNLQLAGPRIAPSHSPRLPLTSSSSTLFMPTPGVISSIGRASPNVGTSQPGQVYFRPTLIESMKQDTPHSSRSSHPESLFTGLVYPRAVDPSRLRPEFLVSSHPMHPHSDSHPLYQGSPVPKHLPHSTSSHPSSNSVHSTKGVIHQGSSHTMTSHPGSSHTVTSHPGSYAVTSHPGSSHAMTSHPGSSHVTTSHPGSSHTLTSHPGSSHSMTSHPGSSHSLTSHPGTSHSMTSYPGTSHSMTSHPGISHTGKSHSEDTHGHSSASEPGHVPVSSIVFAPSDPSASSHTHRSRPSSHSPVIVAPQDKPHSQVSFLKEGSAVLYSSHKPTYLSTYPGNIRPEPPGRSSKTDDGRRDISSDMLHNPAIVPEPDVIVIDADDHKKRMEGYPRLETAEGKQASSMLRRLASAGIGPSAEHMAPVTEPVRPQSLPLTSSTRLMSHTETKVHRSTTPPSSSMAARQSALNPPPPLIQMSSSRDKKYAGTQDTAQESSRPREGYVHSEPYQERYLHVSQDTSASRDILRHTHTPVDNRGGERERRTPVVETVDLTRDREVSTSPLTRPTSRSPVVTLSSSSARATLQKMAMYALAETNSADASEKIAQKKREETYLPPRAPDPKLSVYEQSEAIRKFTSLGNVCVSAPREFPVGGEYPSQPYALMAMQAQHQPHVHPHPAGTSTPPPYGYPFHMGHSMASFHHHPEHRFLVPIGVHQILPHSVNGEELPSHIKLSGAYAHQYPQGASYFPAGIRPVVPTYQPMTVCGHRYPVPLTEERRAMPHAVEVPARRHNDISEQDLAHPFVVRQSRHMHAPGISERMSPSELPKFPLPSRSPGEPAKRPRTTSPEMKPQVAQHAEAAKAISPPAATYLSRIPTRPASVSEMRNRAAVIPELKDTETVSQTFPEPQPVVVPTSQHSSREEVGRCAEQSNDRNTKQEAEDDKGGSLTEGLPMSAFATLVDVAAAARKVDVPFYEQEKHERPVSIGETTLKKETSDLQEVYGSSHARITGPAMMSPTGVSSPPSPTRTSPGMPGAPRYGISTGLVPKPPPLMPITGMRSMQEENSFSSTPLSVSDGGHGSASLSRSPSKLTSPPGTRARVTVSPDGPPPLISRSVISPTGSSQGPPPLIRGIVSPVQPVLRSPESEADSTVETRTNQEPMHQERPDQEPSVSEGAFPIGVSHIDPDLQKTFWMHLHESVPVSSQRADGDDAKNLSSTSHRAGHSQVRTIVETRTYLDSARAELRHPSRHHVVSFQPSTSVRPEQSSPLPSSSSALVTETREATSVGEVNTSREAASGRWTPTENARNMQRHTQPEQSHSVHGRSGEIDESERVQESCQVNKKAFSLEQESETSYRNRQASSPQHEPSVEASISHTSGSETEEGDEGELDTDVHSSSASLHPRVRALARSSQSNLQPYYDASDSETLSAEESEVLPESSDEMFPSTTVKVYTEADNVCESRRDVEREDILRDSGFSADTSVADTIAPLPSTSRDYSDNEDEHTKRSRIQGEEVEKSDAFQDAVTSTRLLSSQVPDLKTKEPTEDLPTTSTLLDETRQHIELPEVDAEPEEEIDVSTGQEISEETSESSDQELQPSQSSNLGDPAAEEDSSEALPTSVYEGLEQENTVVVQSSEDSLVGSSETDIAVAQPQVESSHQQVSEDIPDSSANLEVMPDVINTFSPLENIDTSITMDDNTMTADQSLMEEEGDLVTDADSADACPSTSGTAKYNIVAPVLDQSEEVEEINEADTLENPPSEHGFLNEPDTFSPSSENQPPEISSAMDDVCDDGDHLSCPTFVGEFVPLPGEVDSPDIRSGCSTLIASEASSVCDENISERELKDVCEPAPSNQEEPSGVLSPDERAHQTDDTLSEGEIPPSQESSQSEDELTSVEEKPVSNEATAVASSEAMEKPQSVWYSESIQPVTDRDRLPSQSKETVDDEQLSEGEIPESEDEPTVETSQGSPSSNVFPVSSTVSGGDADSAPVATRRTSVVSSSQETTEQTECYINMIPISPAPPESPSHESEVDRTSPLPQWSPIDTQYSSVMSLSLASRITPFPFSTLSFNVGSANSSARSSPVPQALAVSLASGSSPSSSSLLPRPQEPTPLLSDNYEPLSDDDDDGLADTSNTSEENG